jgi:NAD(P)-dependent dehydrogenase (short-subunit alcohol dehydrogenase family)
MSTPFSMMGRRALVTGASMSIGRAIALGFADHGASVAVRDSTAADARAGLPEAARSTLDDVKSRGRAGRLVDADLAVEGGGRRAFDLAAAGLGGIDVLVVCASIQQRTPFLQVTSASAGSRRRHPMTPKGTPTLRRTPAQRR